MSNQHQHYRLTLSDAIAKYQAGDLTVKGLIHFYILIKCKPGWTIRLEHQKVCQELGIGKTAFYNAISRLRSEGSINWEAPKGILVSVSSFHEYGQDFTNAESNSTNAESNSTNAESNSTNAESNSTNAELKALEPLPEEAFSDSPNLLTNSFQIFINSLSESERENFLNFGKKKASQLPKPPELPIKWIEAHWQEIKGEWERSLNKMPQAQTEKWENHPRREEWLSKIRLIGYMAFFVEAEDQQEKQERRNFYEWAEANNLIWGEEL